MTNLPNLTTLDQQVKMTTPIVVNLGTQPRKRLRALKRGKGRLMKEVMDVTQQVHQELGAQAEGKILVPIIMVYSRKPKRTRLFG